MPLTVSIVSYANTLPFLYGLQTYQEVSGKPVFQILSDYPSLCAANLESGKAKVGLLPIAQLAHSPLLQQWGSYCIGADGEVDSVLLLSNSPIEELHTIALDYQSLTSNALVKILCKHYWKISPEFAVSQPGYELSATQGAGVLVIGDRAFEARRSYKHCYDLSQEWKNFCGLPFVFACWAVGSALKPTEEARLEAALELGVRNIPSAIEWCRSKYPFNLHNYLTGKISYIIDAPKQKAIQLFLAYLNSMKQN
jgi:chorismate dehydratase